jgi:hypothetical protein
MSENDLGKIESMIFRHVGAFADSIQHKLDLVVEGHKMLSEKIDRVEERLDGRIDCVVRKLDAVAAQGNSTEAKLDAVAADLKAHRQDTEAHPPVYRVKE